MDALTSKLANLPPPTAPLLVGVSGGADSVALLNAIVALGHRPHVCHLNHQWRGAESNADAEFVRELAGRLELTVTIESHTVAAGEDAARQARLKFFESVAAVTGIHTLVLAHTADDQVETVLLRLLRGAGPTGLGGMEDERQIGSLRVIRPLLKVTRVEVLVYLSAQGLAYRDDASNADRRFLRNRVRHELLPLLERDYSPAIRDALRRTAEILREDDRYLDELARPHVAASLHSPTIAALPVALQRRVIRQWLGVDFEHVEAVRSVLVQECPSAQVSLPAGVVVYREYDWLKKSVGAQAPAVSGQWLVSLTGETVIAELALRIRTDEAGGESLDADTIGPAPYIRTWHEGDRFQPLGMTHEKKLQDFFVDEKIPRRDRDRVPLLCATDDRIAWVIGHRIAEPFKITSATQRIVRLQATAL